ncbi:MAG: phosphonopyruvate decarboxylase [Burkholderiales bacterium]|nr:phosphonopyruvate decarboxylase [Burkholderiales bacterium]
MSTKNISPNIFLKELFAQGINFFCGVPDSLLKNFCACINEQVPSANHVITANEGSAVALAIGHQIASGELPMVYMQNSGLGNAVNPLLSLADDLVYGIPMVLMIGWRGEISNDGLQLPDEPQHKKQGRVTLQLLDTMEIPYVILDKGIEKAIASMREITALAREESRPVALVVKKNTFNEYKGEVSIEYENLLTREESIRVVLDCLAPNTIVVATTGMASRELYETRDLKSQSHDSDFLTVGGMGHASQISLGIAIARPDRPVICLDGDGAFLMHMGGVPYTAKQSNLTHVVLNNGCHDSVGGQKSLAANLDLSAIAQASGFSSVARVRNSEEIKNAMANAKNSLVDSPFIEIICRPGHRSDLGRPKRSPKINKLEFVDFLSMK